MFRRLAWLLVSRIDIIEKELKEKDPAKSQAEIKAAFSELRGFDKKVLAPYVLARIGVFLRDGNQIDQSVPWFNEIIERPGIESKDYAYNALAKIHLKALNASEQEKGLPESSGHSSAFPREACSRQPGEPRQK